MTLTMHKSNHHCRTDHRTPDRTSALLLPSAVPSRIYHTYTAEHLPVSSLHSLHRIFLCLQHRRNMSSLHLPPVSSYRIPDRSFLLLSLRMYMSSRPPASAPVSSLRIPDRTCRYFLSDRRNMSSLPLPAEPHSAVPAVMSAVQTAVAAASLPAGQDSDLIRRTYCWPYPFP